MFINRSTRIFLSTIILALLLISTLPILPVSADFFPGETHLYVSDTTDLWSTNIENVTIDDVGYVAPTLDAEWYPAVECWEHPMWKKNLDPNDFKANGADWIWKEYKVDTVESKAGSIVFFTKNISVPEFNHNLQVSLDITVDSAFYFYINNPTWTGTPIDSAGFAEDYDPMNETSLDFFFESEDGTIYPREEAILIDVSSWSTIQHYNYDDLADYLQPGEVNLLQIVAINCRPPPNSKQISVNTAGLIYQMKLSNNVETFTFPEDPDWAATVPLSEYPPVDVNISLTPFEPTPIQAVLNPDINDDGRIDLVLGNPTAILVDVVGATGDITDLSVNFEGTTYSTSINVSEISTNSIVSFYPITPQISGNASITGTYTDSTGTYPLITVGVTVKEASDLSVYYSYLYREDRKGNPDDYEFVSLADYTSMVGNSTQFLNETFPVAELIVDDTYQGIAGEKASRKDQFQPILLDAMAVADAAKSALGDTAIGVAIGPNTAGADTAYFPYHGLDYAAISFGPAVRGVVVEEGYWVAVAHEICHVYGLYWYEPEQYQQYPLYGMDADGISVTSTSADWRSGVGLMGAVPYRSLEYNWVTNYTYEELFKQTRQIPTDPPTAVVSGIIHKNGTVEYPYDWYVYEDGFPDLVPPGNYSIIFLDENDQPLHETSFVAEFTVNVLPRIGTSEEITTFGIQETDFTAFHFATYYSPGAVLAQIVNNTDPDNPVVLDEVNLAFDAWVSSASFTPITSFDVMFNDNGDNTYTLHNTNPGTLKFNIDVQHHTGPLNIIIDLPTAMDSENNIVPAFNLKGETPVHVHLSQSSNATFDPIINITDPQRIQLTMDISDEESAYVTIHIEYALKGNEGWQFDTDPEEYIQTMQFYATFKVDGAPTIVFERSFTALGRR
jgi:hypothetical protein